MGVAYATELIGGTAGRLDHEQVGGQLRMRHGPRRARQRRLGLQRKMRSVGSASVGCAGRERGGSSCLPSWSTSPPRWFAPPHAFGAGTPWRWCAYGCSTRTCTWGAPPTRKCKTQIFVGRGRQGSGWLAWCAATLQWPFRTSLGRHPLQREPPPCRLHLVRSFGGSHSQCSKRSAHSLRSQPAMEACSEQRVVDPERCTSSVCSAIMRASAKLAYDDRQCGYLYSSVR